MEIMFSIIQGINDNADKIKQLIKEERKTTLNVFLLSITTLVLVNKFKKQEQNINNLKTELEEIKSKGE